MGTVEQGRMGRESMCTRDEIPNCINIQNSKFYAILYGTILWFSEHSVSSELASACLPCALHDVLFSCHLKLANLKIATNL